MMPSSPSPAVDDLEDDLTSLINDETSPLSSIIIQELRLEDAHLEETYYSKPSESVTSVRLSCLQKSL
jgi:hypothetical protein